MQASVVNHISIDFAKRISKICNAISIILCGWKNSLCPVILAADFFFFSHALRKKKILALISIKHAAVDIASPSNYKNALLSNLNLGLVLKGTTLPGEFECIFQATKDGWNAGSFYRRCDFNPPLPPLVVMKSNNNAICGGYNSAGWQSRDDYRDSSKMFLFKVLSDGSVRRSVKQGGSNAAVYDFGDRAIWLSVALFVPLNPKYMQEKYGRSVVGSS